MRLGVCCGEREFAAVGRSGFSYVEMSAANVRNLDDEGLKKLKEHAEAEGIGIDGFNGFFSGNISLYGDPTQTIIDYSEQNFRAAMKLGASYCVVGSGSYRFVREGMEKDKAEDRFAELIYLMGNKAAEYGIDIIIEPLRYAETNLINTLSEGLGFCRKVGNPNVSCLVDFYHFFMNNESIDIFDTIKPGELKHVHLARPNADRGFPKEEDKSGLEIWAEALRRIGYDRRVSLECGWPGGFTDNAGEAYKNMAAFL